MKIAIIHSPPHGEVPFRNIGLIYLNTVLIEKGYDTVFIDISYEEDRQGTDYYGEMIKYLSKRVGRIGDMPDLRLLLSVIFPDEIDFNENISSKILGLSKEYFNKLKDIADIYIFSNNVLTMYFSCALAKRLKDYGKITIAGGPATHFLPFTRLSLFSDVYDYVVVGEGEELIIKLIDNIPKKRKIDLAGLFYRNGREICGKGKHYNTDINKPVLLNFRNIVINDFIPILAGRGCPHKCRFCSETSYWKKHRVRRVEDIIREMEYQSARYNIKDFHFHDDTINANLKWFDKFLFSLISLGKGYSWESFCTPYGLNESRIEKMKSSGCVLLKMGVQSFSENVLRLMGRPENVKAVIKTIKDCVRYNISMHFDLLTCFPGESIKDHQKNLTVLEELYDLSDKIYFSPNPFYLSLGSYSVIKSSDFNIKIKYYDTRSLPVMPDWLLKIIERSGKFPESFTYNISQREVKKRLEDYHKLLIRYKKDYLFLGRTY